MGQLESTMETISGASDSVNSSLSERRAQLEGLNGVKSNLAKLQLLIIEKGLVDALRSDEEAQLPTERRNRQ